ncbi:hypothetical protein L218DRAFT_953599 [Marasmius fiardii PR-910]|nr:hypothetical protein L218DRAFT_953599 [Marasmius fiardii PR-910]
MSKYVALDIVDKSFSLSAFERKSFAINYALPPSNLIISTSLSFLFFFDRYTETESIR